MVLFFSQLLNGLAYGMLLFILAAGLSLIFGLMNVVTLIHGSFFMLGAFIGFSIQQATGSFWLALALAPLPVVALGILIELVFMRGFYARGHLDQMLMTFGLLFICADAVKWIWTANLKSMALPAGLDAMVNIAGIEFPAYRLFVIALGGAMALILWLSLDRTRVGAMIRAGVDDNTTAMSIGINVPLLFTGIFALGSGLAAFAGVAAAPIVGIYPTMDIDMLIMVFIVIVVGGMGSLRGAFLGSLLIGWADTLGKAYYPEGAMFFVYLLMLLVLLGRPRGLFAPKTS